MLNDKLIRLIERATRAYHQHCKRVNRVARLPSYAESVQAYDVFGNEMIILADETGFIAAYHYLHFLKKPNLMPPA